MKDFIIVTGVFLGVGLLLSIPYCALQNQPGNGCMDIEIVEGTGHLTTTTLRAIIQRPGIWQPYRAITPAEADALPGWQFSIPDSVEVEFLETGVLVSPHQDTVTFFGMKIPPSTVPVLGLLQGNQVPIALTGVKK